MKLKIKNLIYEINMKVLGLHSHSEHDHHALHEHNHHQESIEDESHAQVVGKMSVIIASINLQPFHNQKKKKYMHIYKYNNGFYFIFSI